MSNPNRQQMSQALVYGHAKLGYFPASRHMEQGDEILWPDDNEGDSSIYFGDVLFTSPQIFDNYMYSSEPGGGSTMTSSLNRLKISKKVMDSAGEKMKNLFGEFFMNLGAPNPDPLGVLHEGSEFIAMGVQFAVFADLCQIQGLATHDYTYTFLTRSRDMNPQISYASGGKLSIVNFSKGDLHQSDEVYAWIPCTKLIPKDREGVRYLYPSNRTPSANRNTPVLKTSKEIAEDMVRLYRMQADGKVLELLPGQEAAYNFMCAVAEICVKKHFRFCYVGRVATPRAAKGELFTCIRRV